MKPKPLLQRIGQGQCANVRFRDLCALLEALGFSLDRIDGSHHIYEHPEVAEPINIQRVGSDAKPYQVRQVAGTVKSYGLSLEPEN